ncbi:hypothetical protein ACFE04_026035 [Oxalis oulophora]
MSQVKQVQCHLTITGTLIDPYASGKIIAFCTQSSSNNNNTSHAYKLFKHTPHRTTFIWNTMIRSFSETHQPNNALTLYKSMIRNGYLPNNYTFSFVLRSCVDNIEEFRVIGLVSHSLIVKLGWESYDFVLNGLLHFYAYCGFIDCARKLFDLSVVGCKDVVTWTALINGYLKCGKIEVARELFDEMPVKNDVSWSSMINGYVQCGEFKEALELFSLMQGLGFRPNHAGIVGGLTACAFLGALDLGRWIHMYIDRNRMDLDRVLGTALIDMYAKCGCIETACRVFDKMKDKDVFAFTSLISGLANHGKSKQAIELFQRMQNEAVKPNEVTFICILSACSRTGLVHEGLEIFRSMMKIHGISPGVQHFGCLVDLLGRAGMLDEAKTLVRDMPMEPDSYVLGALLNACRVHGDTDLGEETVESLVEQCLDHDGVHVLLSNIYASAHEWGSVVKVRSGMKEKKVKKVPGCSLVEVDGRVCEFIAGDRSHVFMDQIMLLLYRIDEHFKSIPFADTNDDLMINQVFS